MTDFLTGLNGMGALVERLGFLTVMGIVLLLAGAASLIILTRSLIKFLGEIVSIRREIVNDVRESRVQLAMQRDAIKELLLEVRGMRSDVRETINHLLSMFMNRSVTRELLDDLVTKLKVTQPNELEGKLPHESDPH